MINIVVLFPKAEDAKAMKSLLVRTGFHVVGCCTTGAQAVAMVDELDDGVLVCGYKYPDMMYLELRENLPEYFDMLLVAGKKHWAEGGGGADSGIVCVEMPLRTRDLINTLTMMAESVERRKKRRKRKPKVRTSEEDALLGKAKSLLMERNGMTEEEAHRYLQKTSMDTGTNLVETAQMVLDLAK